MHLNSNFYLSQDENLDGASEKQASSIFDPITWLFVAGILGLNLGYSDYLSVPIAVLIGLLILAIRDGLPLLPVRTILSLIVGALISAPVIYFLGIDSQDWHGVLSQFRELVFLGIVISFGLNPGAYFLPAACALRIAGYIIFAAVLLQSIQISFGFTVFALPEQWMMLDYSNSIQQFKLLNIEYLRPVAFYSEPSVVACVMLCVLSISITNKDAKLFVAAAATLILTKSLFGIGGLLLITGWRFTERMSIRVAILTTVLILAAFTYGDRLVQVANGEDLSMKWRYTYPLDYIWSRIQARQFLPIPADEIRSYSGLHYANASITDTWFIFSLAHLGFIGVIWIIFVILSVPARIRLMFIFFSLVSGAPLYHDKALLLVIFSQTLLGSDVIRDPDV